MKESFGFHKTSEVPSFSLRPQITSNVVGTPWNSVYPTPLQKSRVALNGYSLTIFVYIATGI